MATSTKHWAFWGRPKPLSWEDQHKVYEIITTSMGGGHELVNIGWTTREEQSRFTASANRADVSGPGARHARNTGDPPNHEPMTIPEGQSFLGRLIRTWLDHKHSQV